MPSPLDQLSEVNKTLVECDIRLRELEKLLPLESRIEQLEKQQQKLAEQVGRVLETSDPEV